MSLDLKEFVERAREYVGMEAKAEVTDIHLLGRVSIFGREDIVLEAATSGIQDGEWWVIGGSTPMNLYSKSTYPTPDEAFCAHTSISFREGWIPFGQSSSVPERIGYDAFVCHASEDKESVARPLAEALTSLGLRVWYDEFELRVGDNLRKSIDRALVNSRYGIVILSPAFFRKKWPQYELDGLVALEFGGQKVILPVWHDVGRDDVLQASPALADRVAAKTAGTTMGELAKSLASAMHA